MARRPRAPKPAPLSIPYTPSTGPSTPVNGDGRALAPPPRTPVKQSGAPQMFFTFRTPTPQTLPEPAAPNHNPWMANYGRAQTEPPATSGPGETTHAELEDGQIHDAGEQQDEGYPDALLSPAR